MVVKIFQSTSNWWIDRHFQPWSCTAANVLGRNLKKNKICYSLIKEVKVFNVCFYDAETFQFFILHLFLKLDFPLYVVIMLMAQAQKITRVG